MALKAERGFERGVEVWKALKARKLLRSDHEGAYLMDVLVVFNLDEAFIDFIKTKICD